MEKLSRKTMRRGASLVAAADNVETQTSPTDTAVPQFLPCVSVSPGVIKHGVIHVQLTLSGHATKPSSALSSVFVCLLNQAVAAANSYRSGYTMP